MNAALISSHGSAQTSACSATAATALISSTIGYMVTKR